MAMSSVALRHQPAVAGRIGGPEAQHRDRRAVRPARREAFPASAAGSAACRRRSPGCRRRRCSIAALAASTACAVPRRSVCTNTSCAGEAARAPRPRHRRDRARPPPRSRVPPAACSAASTWPSSERPATVCSTFGRDERMRVPSPAASTIARQVRPLILDPRRHSRARLTKKATRCAGRRGHGRDESANVFNKVIRGSVVAPVATTRRSLAEPAAGAESAPARRKFGMRDLWRIAALGPGRRGRADACRLCRHDRDRPRPPACWPSPKSTRSSCRRASSRSARSTPGKAGGWPRPCACSPPTANGCSARIATLEQSLDGITGSIARVEKAARDAAPKRPLSLAAARAAAKSAAADERHVERAPRGRRAPAACRCRRNRPYRASARPNSASTSAAPARSRRLRTLWTAALRRHGPLLEGLRPVVQMRERPRPGGSRIAPGRRARSRTRRRRRGSAPRMTAAGAICQPAVFDGQRLAGR